LDAPGAVLATSTRTDLLETTGPIREDTHGPVLVFNPSGLGDIKSTVAFPPLIGCEEPQHAIERSIDMIPRRDDLDGERTFWDDQARRVFGALLHAAALGGRSSRDVLGWVSRPEDSKREIL